PNGIGKVMMTASSNEMPPTGAGTQSPASQARRGFTNRSSRRNIGIARSTQATKSRAFDRASRDRNREPGVAPSGEELARNQDQWDAHHHRDAGCRNRQQQRQGEDEQEAGNRLAAEACLEASEVDSLALEPCGEAPQLVREAAGSFRGR